jgi:hypothetical protein
MHEENKQILHEYLFLLSGYKWAGMFPNWEQQLLLIANNYQPFFYMRMTKEIGLQI